MCVLLRVLSSVPFLSLSSTFLPRRRGADPQQVEQAVRGLARQDRGPPQAGRAVAVSRAGRKSGE